MLLRFLGATIVVVLSASLVARGDDVFTLIRPSEGDDARQFRGLVFTFELPSSPTPDQTDDGVLFYFADVPVTEDGYLIQWSVWFHTAPEGGGVEIDCPNVCDGGPQLFTGTVENPTFIPGTYSLREGDTNYLNPPYDQLTITAVNTAPEPSGFVLLSTGLLGIAGLVKRRLA